MSTTACAPGSPERWRRAARHISPSPAPPGGRRVRGFYPSFVRTAKVALPAAAAALLLAVFAWPEADESPGPQSTYGAAQVAMIGMDASGWDEGRHVSIRSVPEPAGRQ